MSVRYKVKEKVFVSFDYDNDRHYKFLLEAWDANPEFEFVFADVTPREIDSYNVGRIKSALTSMVNRATHTLVIIGEHANEKHAQHLLIGFKNWINFEINQSKLNKNALVAVKLNRSNELPEELLGTNPTWAMSFNQPAIIKALEGATPYAPPAFL